MNIYRYQFASRCPSNGATIIYALEIETGEMIHVEHITTEASLHASAYHEAIADALYARFGGKQILKAHHHGVDIETWRGFGGAYGGRLTEPVKIGNTLFNTGVEARLAIEAISR